MKHDTKIEELRKFISEKNTFHWEQIHKILDEKEKGKIDINLDILYKIHNNGHSECVEIIKLLDKLFPKKCNSADKGVPVEDKG